MGIRRHCLSALVGAALLAGTVVGQPAQPTPDNAPFSIKGLSQDQQTLFLRGIGQALAVYDLQLQVQGKARLYCPPDNLNLDAKTVWMFANSALAGAHSSDIVAIAVLNKLAEKFPCEGKPKEEAAGDRLEQMQRMAAMLRSKVQDVSKARYAQCLQATASTGYCDCLNEKLGWPIEFEAYKRISGASKNELRYSNLPATDRELVEHIHSVRDACAKALASP